MRHDPVCPSTSDREPAFELPPRLGGRVERRLAGRAATSWLERGGGQRLPPLTSIDLAGDSEFTANSLLLDLREPRLVRVESCGAAVAAQFGIMAADVLHGSGGALVGRLLDACELIRLTQMTVPIEGTFDGAGSAALLTRGVVMPLAGTDGHLAYAQAVITWKQILGPVASAALQRELTDAISGENVPMHGRFDQ